MTGLRCYDDDVCPPCVGNVEFWFESFQNWQSEFLAMAAHALLGIYLRERGSPESKPVAAPHSVTVR